jgi:hypothetical protein
LFPTWALSKPKSNATSNRFAFTAGESGVLEVEELKVKALIGVK